MKNAKGRKQSLKQQRANELALKEKENPVLSLTPEQELSRDQAVLAAKNAPPAESAKERAQSAIVLKKESEKMVLLQKTEIRRLAEEIISGTVKVAGTYLKLCKYIRVNEVAPKIATAELLECGFHKVKVSEIVRIAHASDANWNEFQAGVLSIKGVLAMERGSVQRLIADEMNGGDIVDTKAQIEENTPAPALVKSDDDKAAESKKRVENAALSVLKWALAENVKVKEWTTGDGFTLTITRDKDYKVKQANKKLQSEKAAEKKRTDAEKAESDAKRDAASDEAENDTE